MTEPRSPIFAHILSQTRQNVELLIAHNQISEVDGREILSRLSSAGNSSESSPVVLLTNQTKSLSMSPARSVALTVPPNLKVEARAIWEWTSEDPNDLAFHAGEVIEIVAETNADWWTGRNTAGKQGLFPSAYVEKLPQQLPHRPLSQLSFPELPRTSLDSRTGSMEPRYPSPQPKQYPPPAPFQQYQPPAGVPRVGSVEQRYPSPQPKQYPSPAPPQQYPPPGGVAGYYPPGGPPYNAYMAPPSGPPAPQPMPQQQPPQKNKFGGLGQTMAQSAAGGVGFGAGAAIGGGLINSIF
ncbi:hypothetical protein PAXINDRAFT_100262 [Paxillus involutus ATCC 200175]|uniref:SH3 domain-containing protein n=1 Tax=Paxillus involutus ATCC 200175 TaxID=664439 RepID=A0A0C9TVI5_PAXIN|nr:hypothetical protein PAXINDRAFT_100262 [Paxillus involutus ATCC 200175]